MHLLPLMNAMLDFICVGPVELRGARWKRKNTKRQILVHGSIRQPPHSKSNTLSNGLVRHWRRITFISDFYTYMCFLYICTRSRHDQMKWSVVCLDMYWIVFHVVYIHIGQLSKRHRSSVFLFNMRNTTKHPHWYGTCQTFMYRTFA